MPPKTLPTVAAALWAVQLISARSSKDWRDLGRTAAATALIIAAMQKCGADSREVVRQCSTLFRHCPGCQVHDDASGR